MGNNLKDSPQEDLLSEIKTQYEELRNQPRGHVLIEKQTQNSVILKEYTFCSQMLFDAKVQQLKEQIDKGLREYVISPVKIQSKIFSSFCSTSYKIYALFQYPQVSLREEIVARQKENKSFQEAELWSILQSCTNALSQLKPLVSLNPYQIFINPDGHLKIIHDDLVDENYRVILNNKVYYAPEKIKNFNKIDSELSLRKESVFSMGMTLLEAAQLQEVSACYNFSECCFIEQNLTQMLDSLTEKYSLQFLETLGNILEVNPNRRASLMEVQKILDVYWSSEETEQILPHNSTQKQSTVSQSQRESLPKKMEQPLSEKKMNQEWSSNRQKQKRKNIQIQVAPENGQNYKLQQPNVFSYPIPETPKNPPNTNENYLFTDPKLLQMIKKDLEDINKLKQSAFYESSKYTYMYPQTQSILNSIRNLDNQIPTDRQSIKSFQNISPLTLQKKQLEQVQTKKDNDQPPVKYMMKKYHSDLVYVVETYQNGRRYEGTTLKGKKHGKGKLMFEDGAYYEGEFKDDKMNGKGVLYYAENQPAYDGQWYNDQFQGHGILYNEKPQQLTQQYDFRDMNQVEDYWVKYQGDFVMDNKAGRGKLYLTNGEIFEGEFKEDSIEGQGQFKTWNGDIVSGIWEGNMLVQVYQTE